MTVSKLKKVLLRELDGRFGELGFNRSSDKFYGDRYDRPIRGGRQSVSLTVYPRKGYLELDLPSISIRFDEVEELVAKFDGPHPLVTPKDIAARATLGTRLEPNNALAVFRKTWVLTEEQDAKRAAEEFVQHVVEKAGPFWEHFSNPAEVLKVLSGDIEDARRYAGTDALAAKNAIALGMIIGGRDKAREIADAKLTTLKGEALNEVKGWVERALGDPSVRVLGP